jgi:hypothetical protein
MTEFIRDKAGVSEAQQKKALAYLFTQASTGLAATGVLSGLAVTQTGTASASVLVAAGAGVSQDTVGNGVSLLVNDTQKTLDILTANPMGGTPRNDMVVFDSATSSIRAIIGTPNAVPTDPTVPTTAIPLARVRNVASATTIDTAHIDDLRVFTYLFGTSPAADTGWVTPTLSTGWTSSPLYPLQVRAIGNRVSLRGAVVRGSGAGTSLCSVAAAYRPAVNKLLNAVVSSGGTSVVTPNVSASSGTVAITYQTTGVPVGDTLALDAEWTTD